MLEVSRKFFSCALSTFSKILLRLQFRTMGLQLFGDCKLPFLGRGLMIPNFQSVGKTEVAMQVFTMSLMYTARKYLKRLSI